jgi:hypothetical protein
VEFCSQLPNDSHACNEVTATCAAAVASLQFATKHFEATKASEAEQSKARLAALKADIDSTRPLVNELGQMWSERLGFQEEIIRLKKALAKAKDESTGERPEGLLSPLAEYEEKRRKEAETLNVTLLDEKGEMCKKIQQLEETESRLRKRLARQDAKAKEVELSYRTNDQDSQLLTERLERTEAKLLETEKELSKMQHETAEREADREAKSHAAQQVLEEWEQSIARHEDERELLRLRAVLRDCDLSSISSTSLDLHANLHADCEEKLRLSEENNATLRRELEEQTAAQEIQRQGAQTILAEWERSINNIGDELLRSSLRENHSRHAKTYSTNTVASSNQSSNDTTPTKSKFSMVNSFTLDDSSSDIRPAELIYHREEQLRALNARSALHEKEDLWSSAPGPAAGSSRIDYEAYQRSRDISFSRLARGTGHTLEVGSADRNERSSGTSEIGAKYVETTSHNLHSDSLLRLGANLSTNTDENHSRSQTQATTTAQEHWRTVTRSSFAPNRPKKTAPYYDEDSDPSVIIQSQNLPSHGSDLFVEGNSSRKIEDLVKKRLRPKRKTVGSMPVLSDPEQSTSSDETFIGRPSVSGNTPDLTISRMQNPIGLPDNTSTPTSHSRRSRILSGPEWLRTRTPPRRERL